MSHGRILCLTSNFPRYAGDSTTPFVANLVKDLKLRGWETDVVAPHAPGIAKFDRLDGTSIYRYQYSWPASFQTLCYGGGALVNLRLGHGNLAQVPMLLLAQLVAVSRRIVETRYDLVHAHWILPQGFVALLPCAIARLPLVISAHGGDVHNLRKPLYEWCKKKALGAADAVTVNSTYTERAVRALAPELSELHRLPMGVSVSEPDQNVVADVNRRYRVGNAPLIVFVGRMVFEKGVDDLLAALVLVKAEFPALRCMLLGTGQELTRYEALARDLGLSENALFLGWVQPDDVTGYIAAADCLVAPSKATAEGGREAQGLTVIEAMAAETPVIATGSGGITDVLEHGQTGTVTREADPEDLAAAIATVLRDRAHTRRMARKARELVHRDYSRDHIAERFSELYARCLHRTAPPSS